MNRKIKTMALISLMLMMCSGIGANGRISQNKPLVKVAESNWDAVEIDVVLDGFQSRDLKTKGGVFTQLSLDGNAFKGEVGEPRLPVIRKLVEVPYGADVTLDYQLDGIKTVELGEYQLMPVQPPIPKLPGALEAAEFKIDRRLYRQNRFLSEPEVRIQDIDYMRGHRLVVMEISPIGYNPGQNQIQYAERISIRLNLRGSDQELTAAMDYRYYSAPFEMFFEANVINHGSYRDRSFVFPPPTPIGYMILNIAAYTQAIQPLVEWKTVQGYDVTVVEVPSGASTATVKALIQNAYDNWPNPPSYVLLNGDTDTLPAYNGEASHSADDNQYTELEGTGFYTPDVMIGRFSVRSVTDVQNILAKSLQWDMTTMPDMSYLKDSLFLASSDHGSMLEGTHEWCWNNHIKPYDQARNVYHPVYERQGGNTSHFSANVNEGRSLVNYSGHGYGDGTGTACIHFVHSHVQALTNANKYPHVMVFACGTNLHDQTISFGERWLLEANKGSVSYWGTSDSSYWDEDDDLERAIYLTQNQNYQYSLSAMYFSGLYKIYQSGYSSAAYYYDIYNLMGDPSLPIYGRIPMVPVIDAPVNTTPNPQTFTVNVSDENGPVKYALVAIHDGNELLGSAFTDATGAAAIYINPSAPGTATITVSGRNLKTTQQQLQIMAAGCGYVVMDRALYNCNHQINIALWDVDLNVNPGTTDTATVTIFSDTTPAGKTVVLTETGPDTSEFRGSILTSSTQSGSGYLRVSHGDQITLHYLDEDCEGSQVDVYDYAEVDCMAPIISNVSIDEVTIDSFKVSWTTDKPTNTVLNWGDSIPLANQEISSVLSTDHSVTVKDLDDCTLYYFTLAGTDAAGNTALDDNHGSYYTVITYELVVMLEANMDTDPGWTYEGEWGWGKPTGQGGQYGSPDPTSGYTGQNVVGYNLNGDYANSMSSTKWVTTQAFDCSEASEVYLDFYAWLGVEQNWYDHAYIAISNNNGGSWSTLWENSTTMNGGSWELWSFDITSKAAGYSQVKIRWGMGPTDSSWRFCGWNIDDVMVSYTRECTSVPTPTPKPDCLNTGDVNDDGVISATDAQLAFQIALGAFVPTHEEECAADCSGDGVVSSSDAQYIFMASLGAGSCADPLQTRSSFARHLDRQISSENRLNRIDGHVWIENASGMAGDTLTIPIKIQNTGAEIDAFTLKIEFDPTFLKLLDVTSSVLDPGWVEFGWNQFDEGSAIIAAYSIGLSEQDRIPTGTDGTLVEMTFLLSADVDDTGIVLTDGHDDLKNFVLL
ncbi:MAG: C25 family cysteine peptidase [bacterium]